MSDSHLDAGLPGGRRIPYPMTAQVVDNRDPERLGRVRFSIPGLFEPSSPWARPLGVGGGSLDRGLFMVPRIGAEIMVLFDGGDPRAPTYLSANWGKPDGVNETPEETQREAEPTVDALASESFRIELDETEGKRKLRILCVPTGDVIHLDAETREIMIKATTRISLIAEGAVDIDGIAITIGGRPVRLGIEDPI